MDRLEEKSSFEFRSSFRWIDYWIEDKLIAMIFPPLRFV